MNRVIKFRAWNEDSKTMLNPVDLSGPISTYEWLGKKDVALMQYTGLKDKNGDDIYEGDIVIISYDEIYTLIPQDFIGAVEYMKDGYCVHNRNESLAFPLYHEFSEWEIIGNIYENPELLEN
ncbi:MAG: hypothetical protein KIT33_15070 [Candidatus Kapabacteria bacterium]|nr:hypothetical protein [Ignavibacteriota bacterium]MCW5886291.1 hypothetical protein [Candidatus Kapabacteria bacterium]